MSVNTERSETSAGERLRAGQALVLLAGLSGCGQADSTAEDSRCTR